MIFHDREQPLKVEERDEKLEHDKWFCPDCKNVDDMDDGEEFTYTGSGGQDLSGNKRTVPQSFDQTLTNAATAKNCKAKFDDKKGGDAGDDWAKGNPYM